MNMQDLTGKVAVIGFHEALTAGDVAQALVYAFAQHPRVLVEEILVRPVKQVTP